MNLIVKIDAKQIPKTELYILCNTALEGAPDFMKTLKKLWALNGGWRRGKEEKRMDRKTAAKLRQEYPNHVPVKVAAPMLGVSERQLSKLVAEGREPFAGVGANIGTRQRYIRIYTERLIAYLNGEPEYE